MCEHILRKVRNGHDVLRRLTKQTQGSVLQCLAMHAEGKQHIFQIGVKREGKSIHHHFILLSPAACRIILTSALWCKKPTL